MTITEILAIIAIAVTVLVAVFGFIFGALWGHHREIANKVSHAQCHDKREGCPCVKEIKDIKKTLKQK